MRRPWPTEGCRAKNKQTKDRGGRSTPRSGHFYPREKDPAPIVENSGYASEKVRTVEENLAVTGSP